MFFYKYAAPTVLNLRGLALIISDGIYRIMQDSFPILSVLLILSLRVTASSAGARPPLEIEMICNFAHGVKTP